MAEIRLRRATADDIGFIMDVERQPGYEQFIGRFSREQHSAHFADPTCAYLIGVDGEGGDFGFVFLRDFDDPSGNLFIKRLAVRDTGKGAGSRMLQLCMDWVFSQTPTHRLWLNVVSNNARARHVYGKLGYVEEGIKREAILAPDGHRLDSVMMSILRPEWDARR